MNRFRVVLGSLCLLCAFCAFVGFAGGIPVLKEECDSKGGSCVKPCLYDETLKITVKWTGSGTFPACISSQKGPCLSDAKNELCPTEAYKGNYCGFDIVNPADYIGGGADPHPKCKLP